MLKSRILPEAEVTEVEFAEEGEEKVAIEVACTCLVQQRQPLLRYGESSGALLQEARYLEDDAKNVQEMQVPLVDDLIHGADIVEILFVEFQVLHHPGNELSIQVASLGRLDSAQFVYVCQKRPRIS